MGTLTKPKLLVIAGPTASGKSKLGIEIGKATGADIVNADSLQVYRHLNIGTAKPTQQEQAEVRHHLIDIINPDEDFNAGSYRKLAQHTIETLHAKSTPIIIVGGTYLYVRVLLHGIIDGIPADTEFRDKLRREKADIGVLPIYERLKALDANSAERIHPNDFVRIERALEVYHLTGEKMSGLQSTHAFGEEGYEALKIGISVERDALRSRIDERVDKMIEEGLIEEVKQLREVGFGGELKPMQSIGYKQINQYLDGEIALQRAIELMKRDTKRFAKRQMTWLRADKDIRWFRLPEDGDMVMREVKEFFKESVIL